MVDPSEPVVLADPSVIAGLDYWRELPIKQQPEGPDAAAVAAASAELATLPPLVFAAWAGGVNFGVKDLGVGQDHLAGQTQRRKPQRGLAQEIQLFRHVRGVEGDFANRQPALRRPVQKRDKIA